jgi:hypothetical protein
MSTKSIPNSFRIVAKSIDMVDGYSTTNFPINAGSINPPVLKDNGNGTATITSTSGYIYDSPDHSGTLLFGAVEEATFTFTDGTEEYVVVDYNNGNPIMRVETNKFLINGSNIITLFIVWRQGNIIHSINQGAYGLGLVNKINRMLYNTISYLRSVDGGLIISETSTPVARTILVTSAIVYVGSLAVSVASFNSSINILTEAINTNGVWSYNNVSVYDNTNYNSITGKTGASLNKYLVRWFYRSIGDEKQVFYILGTTYHNTFAAAEKELIPSIPLLLRNHCMLIGRIIVRYNASSGSVSSSFTTLFTTSNTPYHNDTLSIQGGTTNEYYHLSASQYNNVAYKSFAVAMAIALG